MAEERRSHPRYNLMAQVRVDSESINYVLYVRNISMSGLLLSGEPEGREHLCVGRRVELDIFSLADLENVRIQGEIVREHVEGGYGIAFTEMSDESRAALEDLVEFARERSVHPPPIPKQI